ncbi:Ff.00g059430.m01.CDS01 [Fusarium sp. VM40]|nr:Ff.00g059430.m01.CDS01 [Fusarium sp. VM40]
MPCCIAIIQFQQCQHSTLFKVACTAGCKDLCPLPAQQVLIIAHYLWLCEDCHERIGNEDLDERCNKWADVLFEIPKTLPPAIRHQLKASAEAQENAEDERCERARTMRIEEIQWVAEWTLEYAYMLYDVLHKHVWELQEAMARIQKLRGLRVWDLIVVRDVSRKGEDLFEEQDNKVYWAINSQFAQQREQRRQMRRDSPPAAPKPLPPTFAEWDKDREDESDWSEDSSKTGYNGDVILQQEGDDDSIPVTSQRAATPSPPPHDTRARDVLGITLQEPDLMDIDED